MLDIGVYLAQLVVAALAFLLPTHVATNFGTFDQYLAVFAGGFLGKVVLGQSLALVRSTRLAPAPDPAPEPGAN